MKQSYFKSGKHISLASLSALVVFSAFPVTATGQDSVVAKGAESEKKVYDPSVEALVETFATGDSSNLDGFISDRFVFKGIPPQMNKMALSQAFGQAKGMVSGLAVSQATKTEAGYELLLKSPIGQSITLNVDEAGKFLSFPFFEASTEVVPVAEKKPEVNAKKVEDKSVKLLEAEWNPYTKSVDALSEAFLMGKETPLEGSLSEGFGFEGVPADMTQSVLSQAIGQLKGQVDDLAVTVKKKTKEGYDLSLVASDGKVLNVKVDDDGKFTYLPFVQQVGIKAEVQNDLDVAPVSQDTIPFEIPGGGSIVIKGSANGIDGYFSLDTGAPVSILNSSVIRNLKGEKISTRGVHGDVADVSEVFVNCISYGKIKFEDTTAFYQPQPESRDGRTGLKNLGVIGYDSLKDFEIVIDYDKSTISSYRLKENGDRISSNGYPELAPKSTIKFTLSGHLPVIDCQVAGQKLKLVLDTGAETNLISLKHSDTLAEQTTHKHQMNVTGFENTPTATVGCLLSGLSVDGRKYPRQHTMFSDVSHLEAGIGGGVKDGVLGHPFTSQHRRISINYKKQELKTW